jgi:hypothetical protein
MPIIQIKRKQSSPGVLIQLAAILAALMFFGCSGGGDNPGAAAPPPPPPERMVQVTIGNVDTLELEDGCFEHKVFFNVLDPDGIVDELDEGSIVLFVNGSRIPGSGFEYKPAEAFGDDKSISIVFGMDYSRSMTANAIAAMEDAVLAFITRDMRPGDHAQIIKFAGDLMPSAWGRMPEDKNALVAFVRGEGPKVFPGTEIYGTADLAVTQLRAMKEKTDRLTVILLTDGTQNPDRPVAVLDAVIRDAQDAGVSFFNIGFMFNQYFSEHDIKRLGRETGGLYFRIQDRKSLLDKYGELGNILFFDYHLVSYEICGPAQAYNDVELQVQIGDLSGMASYSYAVAVSH